MNTFKKESVFMNLTTRQQDILEVAEGKSIDQITNELQQYFYNNIVMDIFYLIENNYLALVQGATLTYMVKK